MFTHNKNVTYLNDLPELEDLNSKGHHVPEKFKKFIRNGMGNPPEESGMKQQEWASNKTQVNLGSGATSGREQPANQSISTPTEEDNVQTDLRNIGLKHLLDTPSCLDIHAHVQQCPICSKFFKHDNTLFIIAIVFLSILCILLLKKVLNL